MPKAIWTPERYRKYLKSTSWARKRAEVMRQADHRCIICGSPDKLHVHHVSYERLSREEPADLAVLCEQCHECVHGRKTLDRTGLSPPKLALFGELREKAKRNSLRRFFEGQLASRPEPKPKPDTDPRAPAPKRRSKRQKVRQGRKKQRASFYGRSRSKRLAGVQEWAAATAGRVTPDGWSRNGAVLTYRS